MNTKVVLSELSAVGECKVEAVEVALLADVVILLVMRPEVLNIAIDSILNLACFGVLLLLPQLLTDITVVVMVPIVLV